MGSSGGAPGVLERRDAATGGASPDAVVGSGRAPSNRSAPARGRRVRLARLYPYLLVTPTCLFLLSVFLYPVLYSLYLSTRRMQLFEFSTGGRFAGLANYLAAARDPLVWNALTQTAVFVVGAVTIELTLGLGVALFLNQRLPGRRFLRAVALFPLMLTPVVLGITFRILFNYSYGIVNYGLGRVGVDPVVWLAATPWAMIAVIVTDVWNQTPFVTLLLLAGLQSIPEEYYEAARVDGAGAVLRFLHVTLPLLAPVVFVAVFWRFVATFRVFDIVFVMTGGGPAESTETLSILVNKLAFSYGQLGYSAAVAVGMVLFMATVAVVYYRASSGVRGTD
jgi:multiple sugar transport system permease protein